MFIKILEIILDVIICGALGFFAVYSIIIANEEKHDRYDDNEE